MFGLGRSRLFKNRTGGKHTVADDYGPEGAVHIDVQSIGDILPTVYGGCVVGVRA